MLLRRATLRLGMGLILGWSVVTTAGIALAEPASQAEASDDHGARPTRRPRPEHDAPAQGEAHSATAKGVSAHEAPTHGAPTHGAPTHGGAAKGHGAAEHVPTFADINWASGLLGESDVTEPTLLWRPKGMPVPLLATFFNWGVMVGLIVLLARKHLPAALRRRKEQIVEGMQAAARMKEESSKRLSEYQAKLDNISQEIERVKAEMLRAGELERQRILAEAAERRTRMERDARRLVETELHNAAEELRREVADHALRFAEETVRRALSPTDQQRLFDEGIGSLQKLGARSLGGQS